MVRAVNDDGVIVQALGLELVHDHADHVVDHGAVAVIASRDLLEALPAVVAQAPHLLAEIIAIGLIQQVVAVAGMLGDVLRVVHGIVRLRHNAGAVRPPEVGPDEEGLVLLLRLVDQAVGLVGHKVLDGALHRAFVLAEHLLNLQIGVVAQKAVGDVHVLETVLLQVFLIVVGHIVRRLVEHQMREHAAAREGIAHKRLAVVKATALRRQGGRNVPLACIAAVVTCIVHAVTQKGGALLDIREVVDHAVLVGVQASHHAGPGGGANGGTGVGIGELHTLGGQLVNVRRFADVVHAVGTDRIQPLLIRQDEENVLSLCHDAASFPAHRSGQAPSELP